MTKSSTLRLHDGAGRRFGIALLCVLPCAAAQASSAHLFTEGFEKPAGTSAISYLSGRGWYDLSNPTIVTDEKYAGTSSLAYTINQGQTANGGMRLQIPDLKTVYLRYARRYPTSFLWPAPNYGPHDFHVWANASQYQPPTSVPFAFYVEQCSRTVNGVRRDGIAHLQTKDAAGNYTGYDDPQLATVFTGGAWHVVDAMIRMNDPGEANGEFSMSVDGVERIERTGLTFDSGSGSMLFNQLFFGPYFHQGASQTQTFWTDNIIISDAPIAEAPVPMPGWVLPLGSGMLGAFARLRLRPPRHVDSGGAPNFSKSVPPH